MAASIKDIARELKISPSTVSRVMNNSGNISEETTRRVMELARKMNYVPNKIARSLKGSRTMTIGVIIPDITEMFFAKIVRGIDQSLSARGYNILLCDSNEDEEKEKRYVHLLYENQVDGIVVATVQKKCEEDSQLLSGGKPVIYIDNLPNCDTGFNAVNLDNVKASIMAVEHLVANGHTRIAAIMGKQDETTGFDRFAGFQRGLAQHGIALNPALVRFGDFKEQSGYDAVQDLVRSGELFTAVYCSSSKMTYGALQAFQALDMKIPEDISLLGFDVYDDYGLVHPGITTIVQPEEKIGKLAANTLLQLIDENEEGVYQRLSLQPTLLIRESVKNIGA